MSRPKKPTKVLVRNPSVPVRPTKVVEKKSKPKKVHFVEETSSEEEPSSSNELASPELCTLLHIAKEMKKIRSSHPSTRSLPERPKYRALNFLPEEKIFQNLIDIEMPEKNTLAEIRSQPNLRIVSKKDPEPDPGKYMRYELQPEYFFTSYIVPVVEKQEPFFDGFGIFNKLKQWKE